MDMGRRCFQCLPTFSGPCKPCRGSDVGSGGCGCWFQGGQITACGNPLPPRSPSVEARPRPLFPGPPLQRLPGATYLGTPLPDLRPSIWPVKFTLTCSAEAGLDTSSVGSVASWPWQAGPLLPGPRAMGHCSCSPRVPGLPILSAYQHSCAPSSGGLCPGGSHQRIALRRGNIACSALSCLLRGCG